jgi:hypothetical protein
LRPDLPPKLVAVIEQAMKKDLAARLPSVTALGEALAPFVGGRPDVEPAVAVQPLGATLATPATRSGEISLSERAAIANSRVSEAPAKSPASGSSKKALFMTAIVVVCAVAALLVARRRPPESRPDVAPTVAAPPPSPSAPLTATPASPPLPARPAAPAAAAAPLPPPAVIPSAAASAVVRTLSEHSKRGSNRRSGHPAPAPLPAARTAAPPDSPANPAPAPDKPAASHRLKLDREDPFGP